MLRADGSQIYLNTDTGMLCVCFFLLSFILVTKEPLLCAEGYT